MLTKKQIEELKEHLEKAQNPVFYYDNDADGLCSFVIFRRYLGRGKGVAIRSFPDLNASYARKAKELNADYIFVLDKPMLSKEFVEEIDHLQLPLVWIDHHEVLPNEFESSFSNLFIYNPARNTGKDKSTEPVTYWAFKISQKKEDVWLAFMGCIADHYMPDFVGDFKEKYPDFLGEVKEPFEAYFKTEIGKIAQALNFGLKDSVTHVVQLQNFLISCKSPREILEEVPINYAFRKKYSEIKKKYDELVKKAKLSSEGNLIFFEYSGEISMSSDIANELSYIYPKKYIAVVYRKEAIANVSLRGKNVRAILESVLKGVQGHGGGHEDAVGARLRIEDLPMFKEILTKQIEHERS